VSHTAVWRNFKRSQDGAASVGGLIYAGAVVHGWRVLPGADALKAQVMLLIPAAFLAVCGLAPLLIKPLRRRLLHYVWASFVAGFGQTARSIAIGFALLAGAAGFIFWQIAGVADGGRYPVGVFAGYAAGLGVLLAQSALTRRLEREPDVRAVIEE
jgi:hypothetical protein